MADEGPMTAAGQEPAAMVPQQTRVQALRSWWSTASVVFQLYSAGLVTGLVAMVTGWPLGPNPISNGLLIAAAFFLSGGFLIEAYAVAKRLWDTSLGKLAGLLLATMVASVAMAVSSQLINGGTGLDPATVPYAVAFLAPLTAGYLILFGTFLLAIVCLVLAFLGLLFDLVNLLMHGTWAKYDVELEALRFVGFLALILFVTSLWEIGHKQYDATLAGSAKWFVFTFEMYGKDDCALKGEHIRRLNDEVVAVGIVRGKTIHFTKRLCPIGKGAEPMPNPSTTAPAP